VPVGEGMPLLLPDVVGVGPVVVPAVVVPDVPGDPSVGVGDPVGVCPAKKLIWSPVLWGSDAMFSKLEASVNAAVVFDASVHVQ